jgi:hypothetical protein
MEVSIEATERVSSAGQTRILDSDGRPAVGLPPTGGSPRGMFVHGFDPRRARSAHARAAFGPSGSHATFWHVQPSGAYLQRDRARPILLINNGLAGAVGGAGSRARRAGSPLRTFGRPAPGALSLLFRASGNRLSCTLG